VKYPTLRSSSLPLALAMAVCAGFAPTWGHEYYANHFQIIHPWSQPAPARASGVAIFMEFTQVESADRLLGASTSVAGRVEFVQPAGHEQGIVLEPGREVSLGPTSAHLVMHDLNTQLHYGRQYPLTLLFEKAGTVEVEFIVGEH